MNFKKFGVTFIIALVRSFLAAISFKIKKKEGKAPSILRVNLLDHFKQ